MAKIASHGEALLCQGARKYMSWKLGPQLAESGSLTVIIKSVALSPVSTKIILARWGCLERPKIVFTS